MELTTPGGTVIEIQDESVSIVTGPYPSDPPDRCYVTGPGAAAIPVAEAAAGVVARLTLEIPLVELARPNGSPIWIKAAAVTSLRAPLADEIPPGERVGAVLQIGAGRQAVQEDVANVRQAIDGGGV